MSTIRETHVGVVTDNEDPEARGRLKIACATLMGFDENEEAVEFGDWVEPVFPVLMSGEDGTVNSGWFFVPSVGVVIELEVAVSSDYDQGPGQTFVTNPDPRWRASLLQEGDEIGAEFKVNYPKRSGFRTASGHILFFDDSPGADGKVVLQQRPNEAGTSSFLSFEGNGSVQIVTNSGQMIFMNTETGEITILDSNKNMIAMTAEGITVTDGKKGNMITMGEQGVQVLAAGNLILQGNTIILGDPATAIPVIVGVAPPGAPSTRVFASIA